MCQIAVLFTDPQSPGIIRIPLKGKSVKFFQIDSKKVLEEIKNAKPSIVAIDATCPKKTKKVVNQLPPDMEVIYVGGTNQQQEQLRGMKTSESWKSFANKMP